MDAIRNMDFATNSAPDTEQILANIRTLAPELAERAKEFDKLRRIPADTIQILKDAGLFTMLVPQSHGGSQVGLLNSNIILEELATIDGSLAWVTDIGSETPQLLGLLSPSVFDKIYSAETLPLMGGSFVPSGQARKVDGGYRVNGRWGFVSGCQNWNLISANCVVVDADGVQLPGKIPGTPLTRSMLLRVEDVNIEDTWHTLGMRGTGSHHVNCKDVFVPEEWAFDLFFDRGQIKGAPAFPVFEFQMHIGAVVLGIAQGAMNDFLKVAQTKKRTYATDPAAKNPVIQHRIGRAEASLRAARAYLHNESKWLATLTGAEDPSVPSSRTGPLNAWIAETCVGVVDLIWSLSGASSAAEGSIFQRRLRDIKVLSQHAGVSDSAFVHTGATLFGEPVNVIPQTQVPPG